jgi:hypothetical protein
MIIILVVSGSVYVWIVHLCRGLSGSLDGVWSLGRGAWHVGHAKGGTVRAAMGLVKADRSL